jgi:hypothetical protein
LGLLKKVFLILARKVERNGESQFLPVKNRYIQSKQIQATISRKRMTSDENSDRSYSANSDGESYNDENEEVDRDEVKEVRKFYNSKNEKNL